MAIETKDTELIMAQPGEYMIKKSSAQNLGKANLDYINETGKLPKITDARKRRRK